jgi:hypothetical protein
MDVRDFQPVCYWNVRAKKSVDLALTFLSPPFLSS